jgi:predicted  nucleic acid-binding Zn-ribbon protein
LIKTFTAVFDDLKKELNAMKVEVSQSKVELSELKTKVNGIEATVELYSQRTEDKADAISDLYQKSRGNGNKIHVTRKT